MGIRLLWVLLSIFETYSMDVPVKNYNPDIVDCVEMISVKYLTSKCLAFLFPLNFSKPFLADVPPLVYSDILKNIHRTWAPNLPAVNKNYINEMEKLYRNFLPGAINHLQCAHIIILDGNKSISTQIDEVIYTVFKNFYENGGGDKTRMVVVSNDEVDTFEIYRLLHHMYKMGDVDVVFLCGLGDYAAVYSFFPFGMDGNSCPEENYVKKLDLWVNGKFLSGVNLFPDKIPKKFNNCAINVSTVHQPPFMMMDDTPEPYDGIEYNFVEMIGQHFGLRIQYISYNRSDGWRFFVNGTIHGSSVDLRRGNVWFTSVGSNFAHAYPSIHIPYTYITVHVAWFFRSPEFLPTWKLIYTEFSNLLWMLVGVTLIVYSFCLFMIGNIEYDCSPLKDLSTSMLASWSLAVGQPSSVQPKTHIFRFIFTAWLFYTIHINLAYTATLTGFITTGKLETEITSMSQILEKNLVTAILPFFKTVFDDSDDLELKQVMSHYVHIYDYDKMLSDVHNFGNVTVLDIDIFLSYKTKQKKYSIYKSTLLIDTVSYGLKLTRNHFFNEKIADFASRVTECGIVSKIINDYTALPKLPNSSTLKSFSLEDLSGAFVILFTGYVLSMTVFIGELLRHSLCNATYRKHKY